MRRAWVWFALAGLGSAVLAPRTTRAGDWHSGETLVCSDCHTMHNSSGGNPMRYDSAPTPAPNLLRHATSLTLCLYCHDGTNPSAPDVIGPVGYVADPSGGWFENSGGIANPNGHDLAMATPQLPPGGSTSLILTCNTCHDPHGGSGFRNLRGDPTGTGQPPVNVVASQTVLPNGSNPAAVYVDGNTRYRTGMSAWCGTCHGGDFHGNHYDATLSTSPWTDYAYWSGPIVNRVRVQNPVDPTVPSADDQVFCGSCHRAHGSANPFGHVYADGATLDSTCQQCHNM